jgi:hypothetical protein
MKAGIRLAVLCLAACPGFAALADERWYWATAQCSDEDRENVYMFAAIADITTEDDDEDPQTSEDAARFGFGNFAQDTYAEELCGTANITAQNMGVSRRYDTREEAAAALDDYLEREAAKDQPWLQIVRVDDYVRE